MQTRDKLMLKARGLAPSDGPNEGALPVSGDSSWPPDHRGGLGILWRRPVACTLGIARFLGRGHGEPGTRPRTCAKVCRVRAERETFGDPFLGLIV
jgi:hypothetical protein